MNSNSTTPLISIIMPAYNAERFIASAIESVLQQTYPNWELLIIDDASTDNTAALVHRFQDCRIRYQAVERIGSPAGVRNVGLRLTQGEFIAFLDADDMYYPNALESLSEVLRENPRYTTVHGFQTCIDEHNAPLPSNIQLMAQPSGGYKLPPTYKSSLESVVMGYTISTLPAFMIRKSTINRIGLFNEELYGPEDYEFIIRLFLDKKNGIYCLPNYVYKYRIHINSLTKSPHHCEKLIDSHLKIMAWLFNHPAVPGALHLLKSKAYAEGYRYLARERLIYRQPLLTRYIVLEALKNRNIHISDWLVQCLPLIVRSYLPNSLDTQLIKLRQKFRHLKNSVISQATAPTSITP